MKDILLITILLLGTIGCEKKENTTLVANTRWRDKNVVFVGDSNTDEKYRPKKKYPTILNEALSFKSYTNLGASGMAMAQIPSGNSFSKIGGLLYTTNWLNYDVLFISLGGNDLWNELPLGTTSSIGNSTFWGAYKTALNHMLATNPSIEIILLNHPKHMQLTTATPESKTSIHYADAVIAIGLEYGLQTIDSWRNSGIETSGLSTYTSDNVHLNELGQQLYANYLLSVLKK